MPNRGNKVAFSWQWACSTCCAQTALGGGMSQHHSLWPACPGRQTRGCLHVAVWQNTAVPEHISNHSTAWAVNIQNIFCFPVFSSHQSKQSISEILSAEAKTILDFFPLFPTRGLFCSASPNFFKNLHPSFSSPFSVSYLDSLGCFRRPVWLRTFHGTLIHNILMRFLVYLGIRQFWDTTLWFLVPFHPSVPKWNQQIQDTYRQSEKNSLESFSQFRVLAME